MNAINDVFGNAIEDYYNQPQNQIIHVHSPDFEDDEILVSYLFRDFTKMPAIEQQALQLCKGKILDVGCGAGSHSLYLQNQKLDVLGIDTSPKSLEICVKRGVKSIQHINFFELQNKEFDTLLFMMNGIGIVGRMEHIHRFFEQIKKVLKPNGQILLDSSDLSYLYEDTEEDIYDSPFYYGEMEYQISFKQYKSKPFYWLYLDFNSLTMCAALHGFTTEKIMDGDHFDYLARLTYKTQ